MLLAEALRAHGYPLHILHVNYGLRGPESDADEAFVRAWARETGCPIRVVNAPEHFGTSPDLQARARELRYGAAFAWREELSASVITTAHHADDQLETIIMRLNRSSGVGGLAAIRARNGSVLRPLLGWRRAELVGLVEEGLVVRVAVRVEQTQAREVAGEAEILTIAVGEKVARFGLERWVRHVVLSEEAGAMKPA